MTAAFYRALQELVLGPLLEDDARAVLLGAPSSNMEPSDHTSRIRAVICDWGVPPWLHRAVADWHAHTFFRVRHSERTCKLVSGVRPGDPLADLFFNACMTGFIKEMREWLIKEGLLVSMQDLDGNPLDQARGPDDQGQEGEVDLDGPTWVDDPAIFTVARDPNNIVNNIRTIMVALEAVAARHGFCLNTKKGKTECVITFAVKGIMAAKRALDWQEDHAQLRYGDEGILRLVDSYKHLGTLHDQYLCRTPELVCRGKTARTAVGAISWRVLRNTKLPISVRRQASLACIDGALFSAARWGSAPTQRDLRILNAPRSLMLRALANVKPGPGGPTDAELRKQLKVHPTSLVLQAARLRYLPRLLRHAPPSLRSLLRLPCAGQWRQTMAKDLFDMSQVLSSKLEQLPDPFLNTTPWYNVAYRFPDEWRAIVKLYMSKCVDMDRSEVRRQQLDEEDPEYQCDERPKAFTSYGGLTAHQAHKHGRVDWTRRYVGCTSCPVCCGEYWTRVRVWLHLKHSKRCQAMIAYGGVPELPDDEVQSLDAQDLSVVTTWLQGGICTLPLDRPYLGFWWRDCGRPFFPFFSSAARAVFCVCLE